MSNTFTQVCALKTGLGSLVLSSHSAPGLHVVSSSTIDDGYVSATSHIGITPPFYQSVISPYYYIGSNSYVTLTAVSTLSPTAVTAKGVYVDGADQESTYIAIWGSTGSTGIEYDVIRYEGYNYGNPGNTIYWEMTFFSDGVIQLVTDGSHSNWKAGYSGITNGVNDSTAQTFTLQNGTAQSIVFLPAGDFSSYTIYNNCYYDPNTSNRTTNITSAGVLMTVYQSYIESNTNGGGTRTPSLKQGLIKPNFEPVASRSRQKTVNLTMDDIYLYGTRPKRNNTGLEITNINEGTRSRSSQNVNISGEVYFSKRTPKVKLGYSDLYTVTTLTKANFVRGQAVIYEGIFSETGGARIPKNNPVKIIFDAQDYGLRSRKDKGTIMQASTQGSVLTRVTPIRKGAEYNIIGLFGTGGRINTPIPVELIDAFAGYAIRKPSSGVVAIFNPLSLNGIKLNNKRRGVLLGQSPYQEPPRAFPLEISWSRNAFVQQK